MNPFKITLPANMLGKDYVVGDLHGDYDSLLRLLDYVNFNKAFDRLFCVGDLIHRGPKSNECLDLLKQFRINGEKWFFSTLGNHDVFADQTIKQFSKYDVNYQPYEYEMQSLPFMYEVEHPIFGHYWITHGELGSEILFGNDMQQIKLNKNDDSDLELYRNIEKIQNYKLNDKDKINAKIVSEDLTYAIKEVLLNPNWQPSKEMQFNSIWSRELFLHFFNNNHRNIIEGNFDFLNKFKERANKLKVFCGHSLVPFPMVIGNQIYCDTGACFGYDKEEEKILKGFSMWGSRFFGLSLIDVNMGTVHTCISSPKSLSLPDNKQHYGLHSNYKRGDIVTLQEPLYKNIFEHNIE